MTEGIIQKAIKRYADSYNNCKCDYCKLLPGEIIVLQQDLIAEIKKMKFLGPVSKEMLIGDESFK